MCQKETALKLFFLLYQTPYNFLQQNNLIGSGFITMKPSQIMWAFICDTVA